MHSLILLFFLIILPYISGSPEPLVSSSGMISLLSPSDRDVSKESNVAKVRDQTLPIRIDRKLLPSPDPEPANHAKKEVPYDRLSMLSNLDRSSNPASWVTDIEEAGSPLDMAADPVVWSRKVPGVTPNDDQSIESNSMIWEDEDETEEISDESSNELSKPINVIYSTGRKSVLRPYSSDPNSSVRIPTMIITSSTTANPLLFDSVKKLQVPQLTKGKSIVLNSGAHDSESQRSLIDGGETSSNDSSELIINSPKFVFVDDGQLSRDIYDEMESSPSLIRISRKNADDTGPQPPTNETAASPSPNVQVEEKIDKEPSVSTNFKVPWEDDEIIGTIIEDPLIENIEVSFRVASKLCKKLATESNDQSKRYYLWAPINQYVPLLRKAFPIRPPLFAPECLKWVLRQCRGTVKLPMLKPCTYWAPMPIRRPECGFNPTLQSKLVNFRLPEFVPGNCPCVWPCTKRFDPIQRCRVTVNESEHQFDHIHSDGDPWNEKEIMIQENLALQLCRGMKLAMSVDHPIPIGWLPIRVDVDTEVVDAEEGKDETSNSNSQTSTVIVRKKRDIPRKIKREKVYFKPASETSPQSDEDNDEVDNGQGDRFTLWGTYNLDRQVSQGENDTVNGTVPLKCNIWRYKACPKDQNSLEAEEYTFMKGKRKKRSVIPEYLSRLTLGLSDEGDIEALLNKPRYVRQLELDEDDVVFERTADCGKWTKTESYQCILEEHIRITLRTESSEEVNGDNDQYKSSAATQKKKVMKELCPGSNNDFPCFLRRKRSLFSTANIAEFETQEEKVEFQDYEDNMQKGRSKRDENDIPMDETEPYSSTYLINKIQIRPDSSCMCEWPCMPFFDNVNRCYNSKGEILLDKFGRPKIAARSFRKSQRDPVVCINFVEVDDIYCKIKE